MESPRSACLLDHFAGRQDPRVARNQRHALRDSRLRAVCEVVSGADGWVAIEDFGRDKLAWLRWFAGNPGAWERAQSKDN